MAKKFKAVFVKHPNNDKTFLFEAPYHGDIKVGDKAIVETKNGLAQVDVILTDLVNLEYYTDREFFKKYLTITGATEPLKRVKSVIKQTDLEYEDEVSADEDED